MADFTDDFNRTQDSAVGNGWTDGPSAAFYIDAGRTYDLSGGTGRYCYRTGAADMDVSVVVRHTNGASAVPPGGIVLRNDGSGNFIVARFQASSGQVSMMRWAAGVYTADIGSAVGSVTINTDSAIRATAEGATYKIYVDGVLKKTETYSNATYNANANYGLYSESGSLRFDDLSYTALATATLTLDRDNVLTGSGTVVLTLTGANTAWAGSPFSLTGAPTGWSIASQSVISGTSATVTLTRGSGTGSFSVTDGTASDALTATNTATTLATGNSSAAATWDVGSVPASANDVQVAAGHTLTINANLTIDDLAVSDTGNVTVAAGVTLTLDTAAVGNSVFQLGETGGGANLVFGASFTVGGNAKTNARFRTRGSGGSVASTAAGTITVTDGLFDVQGTGTFTNVGDASTDSLAIAVTSASAGTHTLAGWARSNCGRVNTANTLPAGMGVTYSLTEPGAAAGSASLRLSGDAPSGGVTRLVDLASFAASFQWTEGAFTVTRSVLDGEGGGLTNSGSWAAGQFGTAASPNFVRSANTSGGGLTGFPLRGDAYAYFLGDGGTDNPHNPIVRDTGAQQTLGGVVEYTRTTTTDSGNAPYGAGDWVLQDWIALPGVNADSPGAVTPAGNTLTVRLRHCTVFAPNYSGGVLIGDGGEATGQVPVIEDSVFWHGTAASAVAVTATGTATTTNNVVTPAGAAFNGFLNAHATRYQGSYPTTQPGANDSLATGLPGDYFVDPARNVATWAAARGSVGATYADRVADARGYLRADPALVADLLAHVRAGFVVRYAPWRTASSTGTVLGAVQSAPPGAGSVVAPLRQSRNRSLLRR